MRKMIRRVVFCALAAFVFWFGTVAADRQKLSDDLIRLHVVANSDSEADQSIKLRVRDAVLETLSAAMADISDPEEAKRYLQENLPKIRETANRVVDQLGVEEEAVVTLCREQFDTRHYDTFSLPAGIYHSLRITIGEGAGKNWWCVVFPGLCIPATSQGFEDVAAGAGFPEALRGALTGEEEYEIRFFILDWLGKLEEKWHGK